MLEPAMAWISMSFSSNTCSTPTWARPLAPPDDKATPSFITRPPSSGLSRRLWRADEKIGSLVLLDVNGRVAHLLLRMADDEGGDRITRKLTHHTIAQMIGSSRETVSRTMRNLVERGIIAVTRKDITLRDRRSLMLAARRA